MKKILFTLLASLLCVVMAKADHLEILVMDTLSKKVINGLEVIPIKRTFESGVVLWKLRVSDFEKYFQKFESRYPGFCEAVSRAKAETICERKDDVWHKMVHAEIKTLASVTDDFNICLYINKEGAVFTDDFDMPDDMFQKLNTLPPNTMKDLYYNLINEKCSVFKRIEFSFRDRDGTISGLHLEYFSGFNGLGKEYVAENLSSFMQNLYGTRNVYKIQEMFGDGTIGKIFEEQKLKLEQRK